MSWVGAILGYVLLGYVIRSAWPTMRTDYRSLRSRLHGRRSAHGWGHRAERLAVSTEAPTEQTVALVAVDAAADAPAVSALQRARRTVKSRGPGAVADVPRP
jgi:hypothetical protein